MSGTGPVSFAGKDLYQPGYYGKRNFLGASGGGASGSRLLLIGESKAGIPFNASGDYPGAESRINWVANTADLVKVLRDGPAYYGALFALTPSTEFDGAPAVGVIRVNKATRSAKTINDVDTDPILDIKSLDYGLYTNQIRFKISAGTTAGKKVSIKFQDSTIEQDNIVDKVFSFQYVGAGTACALTLDPVGNLVTTVTGGPGGENLSIDLTAYDTVGNLVAYLQTLTAYSASLTGDGNAAVSKLDKIKAGDAVNIVTAYSVQATLEALLTWINNSSQYLVAAITATGTPERRLPANMADYAFVTGGTEGSTPVQQDWQDALDQVARVVDASFVGVMTSNASVHAALNAHISAMSDVNGRNERQGCVGAASGDTKAARLAAAAVVNSDKMGYFGSPFKRYDKNGALVTWAPFYGAAMILGLSAGNDITFAPTNKSLNVVSIEEDYSNVDKDDYIKAGVMIAAPSPLGGIRVVRSVTTYQGTNKIQNEWSAMRTALFLTKDHRTFVEGLVSQPGDATSLESIKNAALRRLDYYVDKGWLIVDPQFGNAYRSFTFNVDGDVISISYEGTLVIPVNFILVTHNFVVIGVKK